VNRHKLKVGVIGTGYLGRVHARIYSQMKEFELIGVIDADVDTAARVAAEFSCSASSDPLSLIGKVDAVSVVVPTSSHAEVTLPYLDGGISVLLEKPIAASVSQAEALVSMANSKSIPLLIGHLERFNPALVELSKRLRAPVFIEVHRLNPFSERATDVDVVTDLMIHDLDIVSSLLGEGPATIQAVGRSVLTGRTDVANAHLVYAGGTVANFTASRVSQEPVRRMRVYEEGGYFDLDFNSQKLLVAERVRPAEGRRFGQMDYTTVSPVKVQPLEAEFAHFYDVVKNGATPRVPGEQGLLSLQQVEQINAVINGVTGN
jgi:predicted dehydrogenase